MLLDSNIIIYAARPEHRELRQFIAERTPAVSIISYIEVLGYHQLKPQEQTLLEQFFHAADILPLSDAVVQGAVRLRQQKKMSLGDSIIAATALAHGRTLITHNTDDFAWVPGLQLLDPLAPGE